MKNLILIFASVIILTSCKTQKVIEKHFRDSIHTENTVTKYRDSLVKVYLPSQVKIVHDTVIIYVNGKPYTSNIITAQTDYAQAFAQIILGKLTLKIENKNQVQFLLKNAIRETLTEIFTSSINSNQKETIKIEYKMYLVQKIFFWIGLLAFILTIAFFLVLKFKKV
jgi:hypothetical protein